jgi:hypothetical protein
VGQAFSLPDFCHGLLANAGAAIYRLEPAHAPPMLGLVGAS